MLSRYFSAQTGNEVVASSKGMQVTNDATLPYQSTRWVVPNYVFHRQEILTPVNNSLTFQTGQTDPIRFSVSTGENIVVPPNQIKFSYKLRFKTGAQTYLSKIDAINHTYCQVAGLNPANGNLISGSSASNASTVSCIYIRNSCAPFRLLESKKGKIKRKLIQLLHLLFMLKQFSQDNLLSSTMILQGFLKQVNMEQMFILLEIPDTTSLLCLLDNLLLLQVLLTLILLLLLYQSCLPNVVHLQPES